MPPTITREQVERRFTEVLMDFGIESDEIHDETPFEALDIDSLDLAALAHVVEEDFNVSITTDDMFDLRTIGDAIDTVLERTLSVAEGSAGAFGGGVRGRAA